MGSLRDALAGNRLVTLTGAGGVGKTRLAVQVAAAMADEFARWRVVCGLGADHSSGEVVPVTVARALGPARPARPLDDRTRCCGSFATVSMLVVLDNCEHLLDACATLLAELLGAAPTLDRAGHQSRTGQLHRRSDLAGAVAVTGRRSRSNCSPNAPGWPRPDFAVNDDNAAAVAEICRRLDGMPLAIELAAARVRALSLTEIVDSLHDRFRLLTGGSRTAVRRQQTLRASVDWSHALLTETERILFRRLAVFSADSTWMRAQSVCGADDIERYQVLDQLTLLVDKSLVVA